MGGTNLHLLHTEGLAGDDKKKAAKECNECYYASTKGSECVPKRNGTFECCGETDYSGTAGYCPIENTDTVLAEPGPKYALRYKVKYTRDVDSVRHVDIGVFTTPNCRSFYEVLRNDDEPEHL